MSAHIFKNMNVFVDGQGFLGVAKEVKLPDLTVLTEDHRGAGMLGSVEIQQGIEKLECTADFAGVEPSLVKSWGLKDNSNFRLRFQGAEQDETGNVRKIVAEIEGFVKKVEMSGFKPGEAAPLKITISGNFYKLELDGVTTEVDMIDGKLIVDGTDQYEAIRTAIGA